MLLLHTFTCVSVLTVISGGLVVTKETVVGVAGRTVTLPCRSEAANKRGVEVCWGRGEPSLFTCHKTVISAAGGQVTYRKSHRYSISSSSSLSISPSGPSDSGFYHCRVQLDGLFNDQTTSMHLIIITAHSVVSDSSDSWETRTLNAPHTTGYVTKGVTAETGSDVTGDSTTGLMEPLVQESVQMSSLQSFIGNTVRVSFIIFIPALLLAAAHSVWRSESDRRLNQSENEEQEEGTSV